MKTICKDCGQDYGKLSKDGICYYCGRRRSNAIYRGNMYIPLIKLKGTTEYNRAMGKRASAEAKRIEEGRSLKQKATKKVTPKKETKIIEEPKEIINIPIVPSKSNAEEAVEKDITKYYTDKGILVKNDFLPLEVIFEWFFGLCQKDNYMIDLDKRRQVYDMLIVDYLHELKNANLADRTYFADIGEKIAIVQQMRTPIDNEVDKYKVIEPIIQKIQENEELMKLLIDTRIKLLEKCKAQEDPKYISNTPSLQEHDYVIKSVTEAGPIRKISKPNLKNKYGIEITSVRGLYGNPAPQPFKYNSSIFADTPEEAKQNFINYLKRDFPTLIYREQDIIVKPWTEPEKRSL